MQDTFNLSNGAFLKVDFEVEAAYLTIRKQDEQLFTLSHDDFINVDYNARGEAIGYEILTLDRGFPVDDILSVDSPCYGLLVEANAKLAELRKK